MTDALHTTGIAHVGHDPGTQLAWEMRGSGPTLLFLHGFTLDQRMWRPQVEALAPHFRVVTYDARGFGRSALPGPEVFHQADDAAALCEHLGLAPVIAVGHSIGAHQMLELALTRPDLVSGFASVALSGLASVPFSADLRTLFGALSVTARAEGVAAAKALWAQAGWFATARETPEIAAQLDEMLADYSGWHWLNESRSRSVEPAAATRLGELKVPALVITGGRDLPYNQRIGEVLAAGLPNARTLTLPQAGHMPNLEDPTAVNEALSELAARC